MKYNRSSKSSIQISEEFYPNVHEFYMHVAITTPTICFCSFFSIREISTTVDIIIGDPLPDKLGVVFFSLVTR